MSNLYLIRNLLSLKAAQSIEDQYFSGKAVFVVINNAPQLKYEILGNIVETKFRVEDMLSLTVFPAGLNIFKQRREVSIAKKFIRNQIQNNNVKRIFITYPLHFDSSLYYEVARSLGIEIAFFEEGPCFYREARTKQYATTDLKSFVRNLYFRFCGLKRGYVFEPDRWFSSMPIDRKHNQVKLIYKKINLPYDVKKLFLSRPISSDYPEISLEDEVNVIKKFSEINASNGEKLYIKFHPREHVSKREKLKEMLKSIGIDIVVLDVIQSSEDILFSMEDGAIVCGYDTTTLVYANTINKRIETCCVLGMIAEKDSSGFLLECYEEYKALYPHISLIG